MNILKRISAIFVNAGIDSKKFAVIFILSFSGSFMMLFYTPLDIYLNNPTVFVVGWRLLLPHMLVFFALGLSLMVIALIILCVLLKVLLGDRFTDILLLGVLGGLLSAYVQTLFLNSGMIAEAGASPSYSAFTPANIINLVIWAVIALLPIGVWVCMKAAKKNFKVNKAIALIALVIFGMQAVGLVATAASTELPPGLEDEANRYVSFDYALRLSEDENIIVFVFDRLDVRLMRETFSEYPHLKDNLYGFTHFENNVSEFFDTLPSMVSMLTQVYYAEGQTLADYWEEAWAKHNVIDTLREHGFVSNLYLDRWSTVGGLSDFESRSDNIRDVPDGFRISLSTRNFASITARLSLGRISPYLLKNFFLDPVTMGFGYQLVSPAYDMPDVQPSSLWGFYDELFLEFVKQNEFSADVEDRVFTLIHLNGAHMFGRGSPTSGIAQNFEILGHFVDNMRELGVFDSSTIIVLGDHGYYGLGMPETVSLFIKPAGGSGALVTDTTSEMSNRYFAASLLQIAGLPHEQLGFSFFDILQGAPAPARTMYRLTGWAQALEDYGIRGYMSLLGTYEISGYAGDYENWVFIPNE
ncbi:MAG: hypothetical protein FWC20_02715 [Oscillospiraceae bacterium]|nr:hypothetical protein [Oscillospiraceae bacterium]MCL2278307.1 hypothetical protein [Oscillospiraceae bacterium]